MKSEIEAREIIERRIEAGGTLVTAIKADLPSIKKLHGQCLAADIPALIGPCSSGGWSTKGSLLVEEADVPKLGALMRNQWEEGLAREGLVPVAPAVPVGPNSAGEVVCPACGTVGPLAEGACGDCGLILGWLALPRFSGQFSTPNNDSHSLERKVQFPSLGIGHHPVALREIFLAILR